MDDFKKPSSPLESWRMYLILGVVGVVFLFYAYRLFKLQIVEGANFLSQAEENRTTKVIDPTQRGIIYDRNGVVLARNRAAYNVTLTPALLPITLPITYETPVPGPDQDIYRKLSDLIGIPVSAGAVEEDGQMTLTDEIVRLFKPCNSKLGIKEIAYIQDTTAPYEPVRIKCNIDSGLAMRIREMAADMPGIDIEVQPVREYPTGELTADIVGFLGPVPANQADIGLMLEDYYKEKGFVPGRDKVGYAGIENSLQDVLGGRNGERMVEVDVAGHKLNNIGEVVKPVPGNNVRLTIDVRLQEAAREALTSEISYWNVNWFANRPDRYMPLGTVIAMNPKTGEILAMVSWPSYENNRFSPDISGYYYDQLIKDQTKPMLNKAISAFYPPGSVFKMPTAIGALNEGVVKPEQKLDDPGVIYIEEKSLASGITSERPLVCWAQKQGGHGWLDWLGGVANSCDVYFYKIGGGYKDQVPNGGLGIWRLGEYARALGYGKETGIELPGETTGLIPDPNWKRINQGESWTIGDTYIASMGQGLITSTPLQVLISAATLANDGKQMKPTIIHDILDSEGNVVKPFEPTLHWDITKDPLINEFNEYGNKSGVTKVVQPWVVAMAKQAMRMVVTDGTAKGPLIDILDIESQAGGSILSAGKTGTAEYCDESIKLEDKPIRCKPGSWPAHAWYFGYAPYDDPEIAVVAFVYNGYEGSTVAAPVVGRVLQAYFRLKAVDADKGKGAPATAP